MDVTTATPVEIDTELARLHGEQQKAKVVMAGARDDLHHYAGDRGRYVTRSRKQYDLTDAQAEAKTREVAQSSDYTSSRGATRLIERLDAAHTAITDARAAAAPLNDEYDRRGGWSRFFLVVSSDGHIHSSMSCTTCTVRTQFNWLPTVSGKAEAEAVAEHGPLLCTVCFPTAPVEWTVGKPQDDDQCPGSGTWDYPRETARLGYYSGNYGVCQHCGERVTVSKTNKMRKHKKTA